MRIISVLVFLGPVQHPVVLKPTRIEQVTEQPLNPNVVGLLLEFQRLAVLEIAVELLRQPLAQHTDGDANFALLYLVVQAARVLFLHLVPGQSPPQHEAHQVPQGLQVISPRLR